MIRLRRLFRRLAGRPAPSFAETLRKARLDVDPIPVRVSTLERALTSRPSSNSIPHAGAN